MKKLTLKFLKLISSKRFEYFVLAVILVGALLVRLYKIDNPVADWHSWRQADTASVTRIYLSEGLDLLKPRYHDLSKVQTGFFNLECLRFVEFPIFNVIHLGLLNAAPSLGFDVAGRLVPVIASVFTALALFAIGNRVIGRYGGLMAAFFYSFLPFNIYFTRVILPDPLAASFATYSLYFYLKYFDTKKPIYTYVASAFLASALLIKPNSFFFAFPVVYMAWRKYGIIGTLRNKHLMISLDIVLIPFFLWRFWVSKFPVGIAHFAWAFNGDGIRFRPAFWRWLFGDRLGVMILGIWGLIPFTFGFLRKTKEKTTDLFIHALLLGAFVYVSVLATASVRHDYYQVFWIPVIALTLAAGIINILKIKEFNKIVVLGLLVFSFGMMMNISGDRIRGLYNINRPELIEAGNAVDELVAPDATVIAPYVGDTAFLYQTKRTGWPIAVYSIQDLVEKGADIYVTVNKGDTNSEFVKSNYTLLKEESRFAIYDLNAPLQQ